MAGYIGSKAVSVNTTSATITGDASIGGDLSLGDNDKIILGAGSDLQIYSDGTTSRIYESGSGLLTIRASNFNVNTADGSESYITMVDGGAVTSYHNGAAKIATSASGIDVTGTATATTLQTNAGGTVTTAAGNDLNIVYPDGRSLFFKEAGTTTLTLNNAQGATIANGLTLTDGNLTVAAGHGINFAAQTAAGGTVQEVLNHYEQGAFTPIFQNSGGEQTNYGHAAGFYVRIGARVQAHGYLAVGDSLQSASGSVQLGGLPFDSVNITNGHTSVNIGWANSLNITAGQNLGGYLAPNTSLIQVHLWDAATGTTELQFSELSVNGTLMFFISYNAV